MKLVIDGSKEFGFYVNDFEHARTILRKYGGRFNAEKKAWEFNGVLTQMLRELEPIADIPSELYDYAYDAIPRGNEYIVPVELSSKIDFSATRYIRRKYDPDAGEYVDVEVRLDGQKENLITIPRGLVTKALANLRYKFFASWIHPEEVPIPSEFRPYQREVFMSVLNDLRLVGASTMMIPTGGGKTFMAPGIVKVLMEKYPDRIRKVFYVTTSLDLIFQFSKFAEKWGMDVGLVSGEEKDWGKPVVAATAQTLYRAIKTVLDEENGNGNDEEDIDEEEKPYLDEVDLEEGEVNALVDEYRRADLVFIDESHHIPARTIKLVTKFAPWSLRISASATPWRNDERDLEIYAVSGFITKRMITSSELIQSGYLVPVRIIMWKRMIPCFRGRSHGNEAGAQLFAKVKRCVFNDEERNKDIIDIAKVAPRPFLILTKEVKPAKALYELAKNAGLKVELVYGAIKGEKRSMIYDAFPRLDGLIADGVANEGLDLPHMRTLIITGGGKSKVLTIQRVGRAVRKSPGKDKAFVVDLWDVCDYFYDHGEERLELYRTEPRWEIKIVNSKDDVINLLKP